MPEPQHTETTHPEIEKGWDEFALNPWLLVFVIFFIIEMAIPLLLFVR